jgi:hypothetical protein
MLQMVFPRATENNNVVNVVSREFLQSPVTKKQVRAFLGPGYYRKFIQNYAAVALPLTDLTKKSLPDKVK